jgi:uncharacterized protein
MSFKERLRFPSQHLRVNLWIGVESMVQKAIAAFMVLVAVSLISGTALAAEPTLHDVYQAAEAGRLKEAQSMMDQVLRDHPDSAKAHYVEAELLAKQGRGADAEVELSTAERLAPGLAFVKPEAVEALKARIGTRGTTQSALHGFQPPASNGLPWGMVLIGLGVVAFIIFVARAMGRRNPVVPAGGSGYGPGGTVQPYGAGGVPPMGPTAGGIGSGIMGGLATGAALGAGVVAGEALAHRLMDGHQSGVNVVPPVNDEWNSSRDDMGGNDFGIADNSSWDDSSGGGGDDWT